MKKLILCLILAVLTLCGCEAEGDNVKNAETSSGVYQSGEEDAASSALVCGTGILSGKELFTERDLLQTAVLDTATELTLSDGNEIEIDKEGIYVLRGNASDFLVKISVGSEDKVQLILDGVDISNADKPAVYVESADKVFITTTEGTVNNISVSGTFDYVDDGADGAVFSRSDLVLNGEGELRVDSSYNGIVSKDDLKITGGVYNVTAVNNAFEANDSIRICGGSFTVPKADDGFHASNDDDDTLGYVYISGGEFSLTTTSDGIRGNAFVQIDGGTFNITSVEGIEGTTVQINGGDISINASDDGINASKKSTSYEVLAEFNGGKITIVMGQGDTDGIDSNGRIVVNGGEINVTGQSTFDYESSAEFNGGTIIVNGEEVDEIPQSMMGGDFGGKGGGLNGKYGGFSQGGMGYFGGKQEDLDPENIPDDFDPENLPEDFTKGGMRGDFDLENIPDDFDLENIPDDFDLENIPDDFDPDNIPDDFDPENLPEDFTKGGMRGDFDPENMPEEFDKSSKNSISDADEIDI